MFNQSEEEAIKALQLETDHLVPSFVTNPDILLSDNYVVLDFETTNLSKGSAIDPNNKLVLACWLVVRQGKVTSRRSKIGDEFAMEALVSDINSADFVVAHNAKFELQWLRRCGLDLRRSLPFCTLLAEWVIWGNLAKGHLKLEEVGKRYLKSGKMGLVNWWIHKGVCPSQIPKSLLLEYCWQDVDLAHQVFLKQRELIVKRNQLHILHTRNLTCAVLADIEFSGVRLDKNRVNPEYRTVTQEQAGLERLLEASTGGINLNSTKQLAEYLYETLGFDELKDWKGNVQKTDSGRPLTDQGTISQLVPKNEEQGKFLALFKRYNKNSSRLSKCLEFYKAICDEQDGVFRANFNQGVVSTHRLSSSGRPYTTSKGETYSAQLQNQPREYKKLYRAVTDGWDVGEFDASQAEFRFAADFARDPVAWEEIANDQDVHGITARTITEAGLPTDRQTAKAYTFRPLYGGSGGDPAVQAYCKFFKEKYENISETQVGWTYKVLANKHLRTPLGMIYYWPDCKKSRSGYINFTTEIYNFPIQGAVGAEFIPLALVYFWYRSAAYRINLLNTVHDSIVAELHPDERDRFRTLAALCMCVDTVRHFSRVYNYQIATPLGTEVKVASHWSEGAAHQYNIWPDGKVKYKLKQ